MSLTFLILLYSKICEYISENFEVNFMKYSGKTDAKWQQRWQEEKLAAFDPERMKDKLYVLEMFSYPSAAKLHVGHWYNYSLTDSYARMKKMQGYEVFQPMGFDAFGLPAENYAIKTGIHPKDSTMENVVTMEKQLKAMGGMFNWDHEIATCTPEYYRWNQWLFLQLYKKGLAYRKNAPVNWCPHCQTVLANEQVMADGSCERCHSLVSKKNLTQWFFKITDYAQELIDGLDALDWPERTKKVQINWIGRSEGDELCFHAEKDGELLLGEDGKALELRVFTTRADTFLGVSYVVVAPDSPLCEQLTSEAERENILAYQEKTRHLNEIDRMSTTREKTGVFTGSFAIHPISGERVPIWAADYVIGSYGTGVVMAVPAHDDRDFDFAQKYSLPIRRVIGPADGSQPELPFCDDGILLNSGKYDGLASAEARHAIVADLAKEGKANHKINYRLRDWLVSRQRYWGTPIPIVYCEHCGEVPVPEEELPVLLPYDVEFAPHGDSPLKKHEGFMHCKCPKCGGDALRDPDTLDTFVDSSWYQFRYVDNRNDQAIFDTDKVDALCPVDVYVGGPEHAAMHLLYARFITKALRDMGLIHFDEPFRRLIHQGVILGPDGNRMSKSRGNTISPDPYVEKYGSDIFRLYLAFGFAYTEGGPWNDDGIRAVAKFAARVEELVDEGISEGWLKKADQGFDEATLTSEDRELLYWLNRSIKGVTEDAEKFQFNTSIARMMELMNAISVYRALKSAKPELLNRAAHTLILLLAPFAPHFCEEQAEKWGNTTSLFRQAWPLADEKYLKKAEVEIAVQFNGKIVDRMMLPSDVRREDMAALVKADPRFEGWLGGRSIIKEIPVPGRLMNFVVKG